MAFAVSALPRQALSIGCVALFTCTTATAQYPTVHDNSAVCAPEVITVPPQLRSVAPETADEIPPPSTIYSEADVMQTEGKNQVVLIGNASILHGRRGLYADKIIYHRSSHRAIATGNVVLYSNFGDAIRADTLELDLDTFHGEGSAIQIQFAQRATGSVQEGQAGRAHTDSAQHEVHATATAQSIVWQGDNFQQLQNVTMTACAGRNRDVLLRAREISLDHHNGVGNAQGMTLQFKKIPVFYFPSITFPINAQRKTGFLFPKFGYDDDSGLILETPYYLNLAPHYDATLIPRILSQRGMQLFGQFRYLSARGSGSFRSEFLPSDNQFNDQNRYAFGYTHRHELDDRWRAAVDWHTISDREYLRDFSNQVNIIAASYVEQNARLDYFSNDVQFIARVAAYDSANGNIGESNRPYEILPQLSLTLSPRAFGFWESGAHLEYTHFRHTQSESGNSTRRHGSRVKIAPYISAPFRKPSGYLIPKLALQIIRYRLNQPTTETSSLSPSVTVPIFSLDSGMFFERPIFRQPSGNAKYLQTLEPRIFYLNIPARLKQTTHRFPNFDSGYGSASSFAHFFRENRFFGSDRVGDTEQISIGLTSRILDHDHASQLLTLSLGQVFYLKDRRIGLTADAPADRSGTSGFLSELDATLSKHWSLSGFARWHDRSSDLAALRFSTHYTHSQFRHAAFGYNFNAHSSQTSNDSKQIDFTLYTPLRPRWQLQTATRYSLAAKQIQSVEIGVDIAGCCGAIRLGTKRYLDDDGTHKNSFIAALELRAFGQIGTRASPR